MSVVRSPVTSAVSALAISVLGGGAVSIGAQLDNALEAEAASGDFVAQPDLTDLTSIFQADGSGNPSIGDSIDGATVLDTSQFGGKTAAAWVETVDLTTLGTELAGWEDAWNAAGASSGGTKVGTDATWVSGNNNSGYFKQRNAVTDNQPLIVEVTISAYTSGGVQLSWGGNPDSSHKILNAVGTYRYLLFQPSSGDAYFRLYASEDGTTLTVSSVVAYEVPGNHTTASGTGPTVAGANTTERGPELVENGDASSLDGWTVANDVTVSNGQFTGVPVGGAGARISQGITTVVGETYEVSLNAVSYTQSGIIVRVGLSSEDNSITNVTLTDLGPATVEFVATSSTTWVTFGFGGSTNTWVAESLSTRKVIQLPVISTNGTDDALTMDIPSGHTLTDMMVTVAFRTSDTQGMLVNSNSSGTYLGRFDSGTTSPNISVGSPTVRLDGSALSSPTTSDIRTNGADGAWHIATFAGADISAWADLVLGFFAGSNSYNTAYDIVGLVIAPNTTANIELAEAALAKAMEPVGYALAA